MSYTALAAGPLALLFAGLGLAVSLRRITGRAKGDTFERLRRVHGNAAEHLPLILILLFVAEALRAPKTILLAAAIAAIAARAMHAAGYLVRRAHPLQFTGASLTYLLESGLGVLVTVLALRA